MKKQSYPCWVVRDWIQDRIEAQVPSTEVIITRITRNGQRFDELAGDSVGDSYDNALAETVIGLYKAEAIRRLGPWRGLDHVEYETLDWVSWFNNRRLLQPIGHVPPVEYEEAYYQGQESPAKVAGLR